MKSQLTLSLRSFVYLNLGLRSQVLRLNSDLTQNTRIWHKNLSFSRIPTQIVGLTLRLLSKMCLCTPQNFALGLVSFTKNLRSILSFGNANQTLFSTKGLSLTDPHMSWMICINRLFSSWMAVGVKCLPKEVTGIEPTTNFKPGFVGILFYGQNLYLCLQL